MGRLEKIVVVTVLFLVAVILGVSLNSGPDGEEGSTAKPSGPVREGGGPARRALEEKAAAAKLAMERAAGEQGGADATTANGLLSSTINTPGTQQPVAGQAQANNGAPVAPTAANGGAQPAGQPSAQPVSFLVSREGLEATQSEDWMLYTWKAGDTFKQLAKRFYGSEVHVARLRSANEGREEGQIGAGEKILVAAKSASVAALAQPAVVNGTAADAKGAAWSGGLYEVKSGDVLGTISQTVYGTSRNWKKIYDANRDLIGDNPNTLKVGTKLRIPE